jgi:hypothetical protein
MKSMSPGVRPARQELHRPHAGVLLEAAPDRYQKPPQGNVIGDTRKADGTEKDGIRIAESLQPVVRHHLPVLHVPGAAPRIGLVAQAEPAVRLRDGIQHLAARRHHLAADSIPRNHRDIEALHRLSLAVRRSLS